MKRMLQLSLVCCVWGVVGACNDDDDKGNDEAGCDVEAEAACKNGLVCEETEGGVPQCVSPIVIRGQIIDASDAAAIEGAMVQAVDPNESATGTSDVSAADGTFELTVPAVRDAEGTPLNSTYKLRAQAAGYDKFPSGIRQALPLYASDAVQEGDIWVIESVPTTVELLPLPGDSDSLGAISGAIAGDACDGVLVVAEGADGAFVGYSDADCDYVIFNVPSGSYTVNGYAAGLQLDEASAEVSDGAETTGIDLTAREGTLATVSGNVQIVNAPGGSVTSVVLAVESTFLESVARGEVPPGLRAGDVNGDFSIEGVPDGEYVVLAAFENDRLVRDPDESIGGTQIVHITVSGGADVPLSDGFKVTEALGIVQPGAETPEAVTSQTPILEWEDDSSEDGYTVVVYDAFGEEVWTAEVDGVSGSSSVTLTYEGPALDEGMYYQFRVTSFRDTNDGRVSISTSEDLLGVFYYQP